MCSPSADDETADLETTLGISEEGRGAISTYLVTGMFNVVLSPLSDLHSPMLTRDIVSLFNLIVILCSFKPSRYLAITVSVAFMAEKDATARLRRAVKGTCFSR